MTLVPIADALLHLHITDPARQPEVEQKLEHASALVMDYIGERADPDWDETTAPHVVQAATLKALAHLWKHRGDAAVPAVDANFWSGLSLFLMRTRDPALA